MASPQALLMTLLESGTLEQKIAAAIVVGELRPKDPKAVKLLAAAADPSTEHTTLRLKAIEALGKIGSRRARDVLYPLLDEDGEVRESVAHAVAATGNPAVTHIKKAFPEAPLGKKRTFLRVLAALRTKEAMDLILEILTDPHVSIVREAVVIFRQETGALEAKEAKALSAQVRAALARKQVSRLQSATEAAIQILNHLRDPASTEVLLKYAAPEHPSELRRSALQGLRWVLPEHAGSDAAVKTLLTFLEEDDFQNIVSPALEVLQPLDLPASAGPRLIELAESLHPLVRKFALSKMSTVDQVDVTRTLVSALADPDPMIRELSSRSLREQPGAWKVVAKELESTKDVDLAWRMVHAVDARSAALSPETLKKVAKQAVDRLERMDPIAEPMLNLLHALDGKVQYETLYRRAKLHKRKGSYREAELCLRPLTSNEACTDDVRFELAVMSLKNSNATAGAIARDTDLSLSLVKGLIKGGEFPLMKKLLAEQKILESADYYYLGFHLVEGTPEEREIGTELLRRIVEATARSKVGRSAKSKLRIEGLL